ncbi:hypothetical protein C8F01DRAFT_1000445, partial [Mycena amicta]
MPPATVDRTKPAFAPTLSKGDVTLAILSELRDAFDDYQQHEKIDDDVIVSKLMNSFKDPRGRSHIRVHKKQLVTFTLDLFMSEMTVVFLGSDWETKQSRRIGSLRQLSNQSFSDYSLLLREENELVYGRQSHLSDLQLRTHLNANCLSSLQELCDQETERLTSIDELEDWIRAVTLLDEKRVKDASRQREAAEAAVRAAHGVPKRPFSSANASSSNAPATADGPPAKRQRRDENSAPAGTFVPKLTDGERAILDANFGCRKCRRVFVYHKASDKLAPDVCDFPTADSYKPVTEATVAAAKAATAKSKGKSKAVNAVIAEIDSESSSSGSEESDDDDDVSIRDGVSPSVPSVSTSDIPAGPQTPHAARHGSSLLMWECLIEGPLTNLPLSIRALIDNGSDLVLIHEDLVDKIGLRRRRLHKPVTFDVAVSSPSPSSNIITEYVKLPLLSRDYTYTSKPVRALIAPNLSFPIILGMNFLSRNHIVVDHHLRTVVDSRSQYDLLNPPPLPTKPRKPLSPKLLHYFLPVKPVDIVAAVQQRIQVLAEWERLQIKGDKLKAEFRPIFDPIPHVDDLPTDVYCEITVKDAAKTLSKRTYPSPRKYREAWSV